MLNRRMPNGTYGGVRGERKTPLLDWGGRLQNLECGDKSRAVRGSRHRFCAPPCRCALAPKAASRGIPLAAALQIQSSGSRSAVTSVIGRCLSNETTNGRVFRSDRSDFRAAQRAAGFQRLGRILVQDSQSVLSSAFTHGACYSVRYAFARRVFGVRLLVRRVRQIRLARQKNKPRDRSRGLS
jgi:hypothetical protein